MSGPRRPQIEIRTDVPPQVPLYVVVYPQLLVNTRDRVHTILTRSIPRIGRPVALCVTLIAMTLTLVINLLTADVTRFGLIGEELLPLFQAVLAIGSCVTLASCLFLVVRHRKPLSVEDIIDEMETESQIITPREPTPSSVGSLSLLRGPWRYDFIDRFTEATPALHPGSDIKIMPHAVSEGVARRAIFEHPPEDQRFYTELTYNVAPPQGTGPLELRGHVGILSELADTTPPRPSHRGTANAVRFELMVNQEVSFNLDKDTSEWEPFSIGLPESQRLAICFRTNCLGDPQCNWAAWAEPELTAAMARALGKPSAL